MDYVFGKLLDETLASKRTATWKATDKHQVAATISTLFKHCVKSIVIHSQNLSAQVFGNVDVLDTFRKIIGNIANGEISCQIFIKEKTPDVSPFLTLLLLHGVQIQHDPNMTLEGETVVVDGMSAIHESKQIFVNDPERALKTK